MAGLPKARVDKDAIIADLQAKLKRRDEKLADLKEHHEYVTAQSDKNFENGAAWRKAADEARKEAAAFRDRIAASDELRMQAEGKLRFAEGYIAATGAWERYQEAAYRPRADATENWS